MYLGNDYNSAVKIFHRGETRSFSYIHSRFIMLKGSIV
jgi:hypothetical protein